MTNTTNTTEAVDTLRDLLPVGTTVYTQLISVARDGMSRHIQVLIPMQRADGSLYIRNITRLVGKAIGSRMSRDGDDLVVSGAGMDMGYHVVYGLARSLYPNGHDCIGQGCPSNDHSNDWQRTDWTGAHHTDGGYSLRHQWL